jgi:energy-coupling factor transporter ATP-binding protein EcfA2
MAISRFYIKDCGPIKLAVCDSVPHLMIIAGPNGAGKSTLLQTLFLTLKKKSRLKCNVNIDSAEDLEVLYFQPHRGHPVKALLQLVDERLVKEGVLGLLSSPSIGLSLPVTPVLHKVMMNMHNCN